MARKLGLERLLPRRPERLAKLALALIVARVLEPAAKLATARQLSEASAAHSLGAVLGLAAVDEDELYRALDLLGEAQPKIEADLKPAGLDWITALRAPAVQALVAEDGPLQLSLFDQRDIAEIASPDYPGERLVVCKNPDLAAERARKRADLLAATERDLARIRAAVEHERRPAPRPGRDRASAAAARSSPVTAARVSPAAAAKAASRRTADGQPAHSLRTLLQDLATLTRNTVRFGDAPAVTMLAKPTPLQADVFHRLGLAL